VSKAIITKYIGATNYKPSRIRVKAEGLPTMTVCWDDELYIGDNHDRAAKLFAEKYKWHGRWIGGGMPDQTGNCYVLTPRYLISEGSFTVRKKKEG